MAKTLKTLSAPSVVDLRSFFFKALFLWTTVIDFNGLNFCDFLASIPPPS